MGITIKAVGHNYMCSTHIGYGTGYDRVIGTIHEVVDDNPNGNIKFSIDIDNLISFKNRYKKSNILVVMKDILRDDYDFEFEDERDDHFYIVRKPDNDNKFSLFSEVYK